MRESGSTGLALALLLASVCCPAPCAAQDATGEPAGATPAAAAWRQAVIEHSPALRLQGDAEDGERAFEVCSHCHMPSGAGRIDGSIPQLAGQHRSVVIKQLTDIRDGRRDNPIMYPFARTIYDPQRLANLAAYIEELPIPRDNGRGPGTDLALGGTLYARDCSACHGSEGQGNAEEFTPVLAGQHYAYLLRQLGDIAAGNRKNARPDMRAIVAAYSQAQLAAVADYASRLEWPERQQN